MKRKLSKIEIELQVGEDNLVQIKKNLQIEMAKDKFLDALIGTRSYGIGFEVEDIRSGMRGYHCDKGC